jgi:hypothetical protein
MARSLARDESARWGRWPDPSGTVRERFEDDSRAFWRRKRGQTTAAAPPMAPSRALGERDRGGPGRILRGSWPEPSGTIRERFEDVVAAEAPADQAGGPGDGAEPCAGRARPGGGLARSFREAGRNLRGRFENDSRTIRGRFGGGSAVRPRRRPRRWRGALRWASATGGNGGRILRGSWPDPSGKLAGSFGDDSRTSWRRKRRQTTPATSAMAPGGEQNRGGLWGAHCGRGRGGRAPGRNR